ncbi:MAG: hypothetical protein KDA97_03395 [Acidimicrobiales bacterium]|nr:hypothetical protein [Acidimicrobiales bacterium]
MRGRRSRMLGVWVVAGALAVAVAACSGGDDEATPPPAPSAEDRADRSTPFLVGAPPGGLEAVAIGTGQLTQAWDDDSVGDDEPSTVLAPDGDPTHQDAIVVSTSGYGGYQGGLDQASPGYLQGSLEPTELDGDDARWWPGGEVDGVHLDPALAVARGDIALTAVGPVDRSVLEDVLRSTAIDPDRTDLAPTVAPPDGYEVVGSIDAEGVVVAEAVAGLGLVPGLETMHTVLWTRPGDPAASVGVQSSPAGSIDVDAYLGWADDQTTRNQRTEAGRIDVGDQAGVWVRWTDDVPDSRERLLVAAPTPWGDVLTALANQDDRSAPGRMPTIEELADLLASVEETDQAGWAAEASRLGLQLDAPPGS